VAGIVNQKLKVDALGAFAASTPRQYALSALSGLSTVGHN